MGCKYELFGKEYSSEEQLKAALLNDKSLQRKIDELNESYDPDEAEYEDSEPTTLLLTKYDTLVKYKQSLIVKLKDRISNIKGIIKNSTSKKDIIANTKLQQEMEFRVSELESQIERASNDGSVSLVQLKHQGNIDSMRVQRLLATGRLDDAEEAKRIINFYKSLETTVNKSTVDGSAITEHPFFMADELYDKNGNVILDPEVEAQFKELADNFKVYEVKLEIVQKRLVEQIINSNPKIQRLYDKALSYKEIMEDLHDTNWVDMMMMDITKGIFSKNGLVPQVMMSLTQATFAENISKAKRFEEKLNKMLPKVEEELRGMNKGLRSLGILGAKGVSYDMFFQKVLGGLSTGGLVHRYAQSFFDEREKIHNQFKEDIKKAKTYETGSPEYDSLMRKAYLNRQKWYKENVIVFDLRKLGSELASEFPEFASEFEDDGGKHKQELIDNVNQKGYEEEIVKQKEQIKKFIAWRDAFTETLLESLGLTSVDELDTDHKEALEREIAAVSPFTASANFHDNTLIKVGSRIVTPTMAYNISIPRKNKAKVTLEKSGYVANPGTEATSHYDNAYSQIEGSQVLKEFYDFIKEELDSIQSNFPQDVKDELMSNFLPSVKKSVTENLLDPNINFFRAIWDMIVDLYDRIRGGFGVNSESTISYDNTDIISGEAEYEVNKDFLNNNRRELKNKFLVLAKRIQNKFKASGFDRKITRASILNVRLIPQSVVEELTSRIGLAPTREALQNKFGEVIPIGKILMQSVTNEIVKQHSVDLPKILKYYSMMAAEYNARTQLAPMMNMMKKHYEQIKKTATNNNLQSTVNKFTGNKDTLGTRANAISQMEDWFQKVILGNRGDKNFGVVKTSIAAKKIGNFVTGRILNKDEKAYARELDELIDAEENDLEKKKLIEIKEGLGKDIAASAILTSILDYVRFLGLGYNLSSGVTNFMEGQSANIIVAASGDFFEPEHIYRAIGVVQGSFLKTFMGSKAPKGALKNSVLVKRYDILQDSSNELQKASTKTNIASFEKLNPMEINKRVEYLNQSPLMIAVMLSTPVTGINGEVSNAWDALDSKGNLKETFAYYIDSNGNKVSKATATDSNGNLKKGYSPGENISTWEEGKGDAYIEFKSKVNQAIVMAHGNYDQLRGMAGKSSFIGKALLMFKTWVGMAVYGRFAAKQEDVEMGEKEFKGRYHSHTKTSGVTQGALVGFAIGGPATAAIGGIVGGVIAANYGVKSNLNTLKEMTFILKALVRKTIGTPINFMASPIVKGQLMKEFTDYDKLLSKEFTDRDLKNMKAIISDMSLLLSWIALALITKALLWDDDDDEESAKRKAHNLIVNRALQLSSSATSYLNPTVSGLYKSVVGDVGILKWGGDVAKWTTLLGEYMEGNDIITSGSNAGDSRLAAATRKLTLPSIARNMDTSLGFNTQMEKQFQKTSYDDWFWDSEKKERKIIQGKRAILKRELEEQGLNEKQIRRVLKRKLPLPKDIID